jgi:hypothetical protein
MGPQSDSISASSQTCGLLQRLKRRHLLLPMLTVMANDEKMPGSA